ncbi:hypothetical protein [Streptomyces sp. NPDC056660]|uniref:hypothetical protein n=1 Tax=Streptomyces sp. NPDC056660 TaxID=3345897 RepID=UPI00367B349F
MKRKPSVAMASKIGPGNVTFADAQQYVEGVFISMGGGGREQPRSEGRGADAGEGGRRDADGDQEPALPPRGAQDRRRRPEGQQLADHHGRGELHEQFLKALVVERRGIGREALEVEGYALEGGPAHRARGRWH